MRSYLFPFLFFFPILLVQITIVPFASIGGVVPDLLLILLVYYTLKNNQIYGTVLGFIFGFLFDLITGSLLGSSMLSKTLAGFMAGYFASENKFEVYLKSYSFSLIVLLCAIIDSVVYTFFSSVEITTSILELFLGQGVFPGVYTAVISVLVVFFHPRRRFD
jgi:rod shape-determining protein MreD